MRRWTLQLQAQLSAVAKVLRKQAHRVLLMPQEHQQDLQTTRSPHSCSNGAPVSSWLLSCRSNGQTMNW
jgi:hypothetical protein